jgi:hypothetical protein
MEMLIGLCIEAGRQLTIDGTMLFSDTDIVLCEIVYDFNKIQWPFPLLENVSTIVIGYMGRNFLERLLELLSNDRTQYCFSPTAVLKRKFSD